VLKKALAAATNLELKRRIEQLLARIAAPVTDVEQLRNERALEVLERIASQDACRLLENLSQGAPEARFTRLAQAARARLERRALRRSARDP
jgi:hypothetical protein